MAETYTVDINLEGKNRARLATHKYDKTYTNIPNSALPKNSLLVLETIYNFLTGEELALTDYTYLVRAKDGKFSKVYSPAVFSSLDNSGLVIKWGEKNIPLKLVDGKLVCENKAKHTFKVKNQRVNGWDTVVLVLGFTDSKKKIYSMAFPIKAADYEKGIDETVLENAIEENQLEVLLEQVAQLPSANEGEREYSGSGEKLEGPVVKFGDVPIGIYDITAFRRYKNSYGYQHLLQSFAAIPFYADVSEKSESGEWTNSYMAIEGPFIIKASSSINKKLLSDPVITREMPAALDIYDKDEFNGRIYSKANLDVSAYTVDDEILSVNF